ncbi:hypothetical protein ES703_78326 [subsurface metagenome]
MRLHRFLQLVEWGCNVPLFLRNPSTNFGQGAHQQLKELFHQAETLSIIGARKDGKRDLHVQELSLGAVFVDIIALEPNWEILVLEDVDVEFSGSVLFHGDGTGEYNLPTKGIFRKRFFTTEAIEDVKMRCLIRDMSKVYEKLQGAVVVYFCWAKKFCGIKPSRLVILDYMVI